MYAYPPHPQCGRSFWMVPNVNSTMIIFFQISSYRAPPHDLPTCTREVEQHVPSAAPAAGAPPRQAQFRAPSCPVALANDGRPLQPAPTAAEVAEAATVAAAEETRAKEPAYHPIWNGGQPPEARGSGGHRALRFSGTAKQKSFRLPLVSTSLKLYFRSKVLGFRPLRQTLTSHLRRCRVRGRRSRPPSTIQWRTPSRTRSLAAWTPSITSASWTTSALP